MLFWSGTDPDLVFRDSQALVSGKLALRLSGVDDQQPSRCGEESHGHRLDDVHGQHGWYDWQLHLRRPREAEVSYWLRRLACLRCCRYRLRADAGVLYWRANNKRSRMTTEEVPQKYTEDQLCKAASFQVQSVKDSCITRNILWRVSGGTQRRRLI